MSERFQKTHGWVICLAGLTGLFLTILGYLRAEKLVSGPVREKSMQPPGKTQKNIPPAKLARFNGAFLSTVGNNVLAGLLVATFVLFFKSNNHGDHLFWPFMFAFSGTMSCTLLRGQMRLLRSLPLSTKQLAAMLSLMPFVNVLALLAGLAVAWWVVPERFPNGYFAFSCMIPMAGAICIASSFVVPFGIEGRVLGLMLGMLFAIVIFNIVPYTHLPAAFWWLLGLSLILASYFLNRHWLRSSASYRPRKVF